MIFDIVIFPYQSGSGPSPTDVQSPTSLPPVHEVAMGDNDEYQEITEGERPGRNV